MIGVLALQGAFQKHIDCLKQLGAKTCQVKTVNDLLACDALILPGGESTVHAHLMSPEFYEELLFFCQSKPVLATCCGLILLAKKLYQDDLKTFGLLDVFVQRNAYGSQKESFLTSLEAHFLNKTVSLNACFIRAPQILEVGNQVKVLAKHGTQPVLVEQGHLLAATFHPEVVGELALHQYFLEQLSRSSLVDSHRLG